MSFANLRARAMLTLGVGACMLAPSAHAQSQAPWPAKTVRLIVPFGPGGAADMFGRLLAARLPDALGQSVIADNRPGAGGLIGAELVTKSSADGYTLVISGIASHVLAPALAVKPPFDPVRDATHIALFGGPPSVFGVHPSLPSRTLREFIQLAKIRPRDLVFGSPGTGTMGHLFGVLFTSRAGIHIGHVPYKTAGAAVTDLVAGHIQTISTTLSTAAPQIRNGRVRALAVSSPQRLQEFPAIPTFAETGYADLVATVWFALSGPPGLPADIVKRLNDEVRKILAAPEVRERLRVDGILTQPLDPHAFTDFVRAELKRWTPVVKASGARPD
jgi:tripartite-type tricarboxylate transporter receptor subunit TctC